jgi:proliferating cell nuclear antigen
MVSIKAGLAAFDFYKATTGDVALDFKKLESLAKGKESVAMELEEETHKLFISVGRAKYTMSLLDPTGIKASPRIPELDLPAAIVMSGADLLDAVVSALKVSDHVVLEQHEDAFTFSAKGDIDAFTMPFPLAELTGVKQGESRSLFSLDYITDIAKVAANSKEVKIETGIDYPSRISFSPAANVEITYLMAPRIEQD